MRNWIRVLIVILISGSTYGQEVNFKQYLSNNQENIDLQGDQNWKMLKADAERNQFIVFGESHGAKNTQLIDYNLLKHLNETVGTKNYIAELDYAQASLINDYLQTGNEEKLKVVFRYFVKKHAQFGNHDFYNKIIKIRALNNTLQDEKKIKFTGIDAVQDYEEYLKFIHKFIEQKSSPLLDSLQFLTSKKYDKANLATMLHFAKNYVATIEQNQKQFDEIFNEDVRLFKFLIQNLSYGDKSVGVNRAEGIYRNFIELYAIQNLENQKLYGMWGFFHAHLVPFYYIGDDFISKLAVSENPCAKKIVSIISLPIDSKFNTWDRKTNAWIKRPFTYDDSTLLKVEGIDDLKELTKPNTTTLFKLDGENSPFPKTGRLVNGQAKKGRLAGDFKNFDYANQFVILLRNSDWLEPLPSDF